MTVQFVYDHASLTEDVCYKNQLTLYYAIKNNYYDIVKLLLNTNPDLDICINDNEYFKKLFEL